MNQPHDSNTTEVRPVEYRYEAPLLPYLDAVIRRHYSVEAVFGGGTVLKRCDGSTVAPLDGGEDARKLAVADIEANGLPALPAIDTRRLVIL